MTSTTPDAQPILHAYILSQRLWGDGRDIASFLASQPKRKRRLPDGLLDAQQAAAVLGMTVPQLMAHVHDRTIKSINVGRGTKRSRYRFDRADLDAFKTSRSTLEQPPCPSTSKASSITSTSSSKVIGFLDQRAKRRSKKPSR
jgi:hypothetical protein